SLAPSLESTCVVVPSTAYLDLGSVIDAVLQAGYHLAGLRMLRESDLPAPFSKAKSELSSGESRAVVLKLNKENAVQDFHKLVEATAVLKSVYASPSVEESAQEVQSVFTSQTSPSLPRCTLFQGTTLAVIKPHVFNAPSPVTGKRETGKILDEILHSGRFTITDMEIFHLETVNAEEFLEVYKDVVPEYQAMLDQLTAGPILVMEISNGQQQQQDGANAAVTEFRKFCGPTDPELAQHLAPKSLRARFGRDKVKNAIHCTDLPDDGELEVEYFFKILQ
ncbi:MAG: hypothetical protein SGCHY_005167, partial [Lobulomycetales sp.]